MAEKQNFIVFRKKFQLFLGNGSREPSCRQRRECYEEKENLVDRKKYRNQHRETPLEYDHGHHRNPYDYEDHRPKQGSYGGNRSDSSNNYDYYEYQSQRSKHNPQWYCDGDDNNDGRVYKQKEPPLQRPVFSALHLITLLLKVPPKFEVSIERLMQKCALREKEVKRVVQENPQLFKFVEKDRVHLHPEIKVCSAHLNQGCRNKNSCFDLHICRRFIHSSCNLADGCKYGHNIITTHNRKVFNDYLLNDIPVSTLKEILENCIPAQVSPKQLNVCYSYNNSICNRSHCYYLHICEKFFKSQNCSSNKCNLSHNFMSKRNCEILESHGVDTNETPRDIMKYLKENFPSLFKQQRHIHEDRQSDQSGRSDRDWRAVGRPTTETGHDAVKFYASTLERKNSFGLDRENNSARGEMQSNVSGSVQGTIWSHYYLGNVPVEEICFYSVTKACRFGDNGCRRLHANEHFHWQVKERGKGWVNLRKGQVDELEKAFIDPSQDGTTIAPVDTKNCPPGIWNLFGGDSWQAHFPSMILGNPKTRVKLDMRRLCSENVDGKVPASCYQWYFCDQNETWVEYGNVDTTKRDFLKSSITSKDIEIQYLKNKFSSVTFKNQMFIYVLDFSKMTQKNTTTGVEREVRRRPVAHLKKKQGLFSFIWK